jgi:glycosyltransferase involved in cell wall biosynthesis
MRILIIANTSFKLINFRSNLMSTLISDGHSVTAVAPLDNYTDCFTNIGVQFIELKFNSFSTSFLHELGLIRRIYNILRHERPDVILSFTIKPNIYSAFTAQILSIPTLPNITGLGAAFDNNGILYFVIKLLYRLSFRKCQKVFFQNNQDLSSFIRHSLVRADQAALLPGSGVDLERFAPLPLPGRGKKITFLFIARMLRDKGVEFFAEGASRISKIFPEARFQLLGPYGTGKKGGLGPDDIAALSYKYNVSYLGCTDDVRPFLAAADCVVLPSYYREGTPRSLLEAAAMGRVVITTDMPGCRDVVEHGVSGYTCPARDVEGLAAMLRKFIELSDEQRQKMGTAGNKRMRELFNEEIVINAYRRALANCHR